MLLQCFAEIIRCIICLRDGVWPQRLHDVEEMESAILAEAADRRRIEEEMHVGANAMTLTNPEIGMIQLCAFIVIILLGFPIAFTLVAMGVFFGYYAMGSRIFDLLVTNTYDVMSNDVLTAVPLFLFMGYVVERSNILDRLFYSLQMSMRHVPGALAVATLITCALFATATGIVGAVVTLMGLLAFPAMLRAGYNTELSAGVVCAGGCLGIMIPPSVLLILYGATTSVSVVQLYAAAFIPGLPAGGPLCRLRDRARAHQSEPGAEAEGTRTRHPLRRSVLGAADLVLPARRADPLGARRDPVGPGDAVGSGRRRRARLRAAGGRLQIADLPAAEGGRLPHRPHLGDGLLPVHRLVDLLLGVLLSRRPRGDRALGARRRI